MAQGTETARRPRRRLEFNPMLIKELRGRVRGARAFIVLTVYLLLLSCIASLIYWVYVANTSGPASVSDLADLGRAVFYTVVLVELFAVTAIAPSFTAGAISGERERQTYEMLKTTLLSSRKLVGGKFAAALAFTVLLILAAIPLQSMAFMLGGVVVTELILSVVILMVSGLAFATIGVFFSAFARTTRASTTLTYVTTLLLVIGLPVLLLVLSLLTDPYLYGYGSSDSWVLEIVAQYAVYVLAGLSPITAAVFSEMALLDEGTIWFFWHHMSASSRRILLPSAWIVYVVTYLMLSAVLQFLAVLRVRRQERR